MPVSTTESTAQSQHRDLRSASVPYKRDKDHGEKWSNESRLCSGVHSTPSCKASDETSKAKMEEIHTKSRSSKSWNSSKIPKLGGYHGKVYSRSNTRNKTDVDDMDGSFSEGSDSQVTLSPAHNNISTSTVRSEGHEIIISDPLDSFTSKGQIPEINGRSDDFEKLVEIAERKWEGEMAERIVKGEYEVLDIQGQNITLNKRKKKTLKQKSGSSQAPDSNDTDDEDEGFQII